VEDFGGGKKPLQIGEPRQAIIKALKSSKENYRSAVRVGDYSWGGERKGEYWGAND